MKTNLTFWRCMWLAMMWESKKYRYKAVKQKEQSKFKRQDYIMK